MLETIALLFISPWDNRLLSMNLKTKNIELKQVGGFYWKDSQFNQINWTKWFQSNTDPNPDGLFVYNIYLIRYLSEFKFCRRVPSPAVRKNTYLGKPMWFWSLKYQGPSTK